MNYRAAIIERFGGPEVIAIRTLTPTPLPRGAVRVAVRAAGLNPVYGRIRRGSFGGSTPMTTGGEFAGVVVEASADVTGFAVGDEVVGFGVSAAHAELVDTDPSRLAHKPADLPWLVAGGLSGVGQTAATVMESLNLPEGSTLLIHGASGGVGTVLVQLARQAGLRVIGTASVANHDYLRSLGAEPVAYGAGLADRVAALAPAGVNASVDLAGTREAGDVALTSLAPDGLAMTLVPETASTHGLRLLRTAPSAAKLEGLLEAAASGALLLELEPTFAFDQIQAAHARQDAGHARGKLVIDFPHNPHFAAAVKAAGSTTPEEN